MLIRLDSTSTIGRVFMTNQPQVAAVPTPLGATSGSADLIAAAATEAAVPIAIGTQVMGILSVQSLNANAFSDDNLANLQALANQIAPAIENFNLLESTQTNLLETSLLYQASHQIAQVDSVDQIYQVAQQAMTKTPYRSVFLAAEGHGFRIVPLAPPPQEMDRLLKLGKINDFLEADPEAVSRGFQGSEALVSTHPHAASALPEALANLPAQLDCAAAAFLPVWRAGKLAAILMLAVRAEETLPKGIFTSANLEPYTNLANLMISTIEKVQALADIQRRLAELRSLHELSQTISVETDMDSLYHAIHQQVITLMGDVGFLIALYDPTHYQISVPYMAEAGEIVQVAPFPLGEGLTSILIRTGKPLMMVEDTLRKTQALGAKIIGAPAKSWLGVPLIFGGETLGALIVQDAEHEQRFTEDDQRLLSTLATQIAIILRNARLLEDSRRQAERERRLNEIANKLRHTTDFETILRTTTAELSQMLHLSRAHISVQVEAQPNAAPEAQQSLEEALP
jgi:GAF domain-containing protein